jgi:uncharacterized RDD family membrane protein YckC
LEGCFRKNNHFPVYRHPLFGQYCGTMPDNTIFCSQCGTANPSNTRFCQSCGKAMGVAASAPLVATGVAPAMTPVPAITQPYAGFWIRVLAILIDSVLINAVVWPVMMIFGSMGFLGAGSLSQNPDDAFAALAVLAGIAFILVPVIVAASWLYEALMTSSSWQGTVGKHILGLKVTDDNGNRLGFGRATARHFSKIISGMCFGIGYLMVAFTDKKKGLHDMLAGTLVMKR